MLKNKMIGYLATDLRKSKLIEEIIKAEATEFENKDKSIEDLEGQLSIDTATWGLAIYEKELGIKTDVSKDINERRSIVKSKWRGTGKIDATLIKMVADAWANGDCLITFDRRINIKFNSIYGTPTNILDLQEALENIKPAHLRIIYHFTYLLIKDIHKNMTIGKLEKQTLDKFAF